MANDTATYDPATDELMTPAEAPDQSDEMLAYLAALANESRLKQTLAVNEAMKREEGPPDEWMNWPPATVQPPAPAPQGSSMDLDEESTVELLMPIPATIFAAVVLFPPPACMYAFNSVVSSATPTKTEIPLAAFPLAIRKVFVV